MTKPTKSGKSGSPGTVSTAAGSSGGTGSGGGITSGGGGGPGGGGVGPAGVGPSITAPEGKPIPNVKEPKWYEKWHNPQTAGDIGIEFWTLAVHRLIFWVALITLLVSVGLFVLAWITYKSESKKNRDAASMSLFQITNKTNGDSVFYHDIICGISPYPKKNHYLIVIPLNFMGDWVQGDTIGISPGGSWNRIAQFGEGTLGRGAPFYIQCLATDEDLDNGPLPERPEDAILSNPVKVYRYSTDSIK